MNYPQIPSHNVQNGYLEINYAASLSMLEIRSDVFVNVNAHKMQVKPM